MNNWRVRSNHNQNRSSLTHYGVKGMKWGIRKDNYTPGYNRKKRRGAPTFKYTERKMPIASKAEMERRKNIFFDKSEIPEQPQRSLSSLPIKTKVISAEEDLEQVNELWSPGGVHNCVNCILAYDMRRRGYDVSAAPTNKTAIVTDVIKEVYGEVPKPVIASLGISYRELVNEWDTFNTRELVTEGYKEMVRVAESTFKPGQRGFISVDFAESNVGHVFSWEMSDKGIDFYDAQSGKKSEDLFSMFSAAIPIYELYRLDDLTPNDIITKRLKDGGK